MTSWLVGVLLADTAQHAPQSTDLLTLAVGGGGTLGVVMFVVGRVDKWVDALIDAKRRTNGRDEEHEAKSDSRAKIAETHEAVSRLAELQAQQASALAQISASQAQLALSLEHFRRESEKDHNHLAQLSVNGRGP